MVLLQVLKVWNQHPIYKPKSKPFSQKEQMSHIYSDRNIENTQAMYWSCVSRLIFRFSINFHIIFFHFIQCPFVTNVKSLLTPLRVTSKIKIISHLSLPCSPSLYHTFSANYTNPPPPPIKPKLISPTHWHSIIKQYEFCIMTSQMNKPWEAMRSNRLSSATVLLILMKLSVI